ncbi:MAG TPA: urease accessory protein UreE [Burkholderiales bacterium]|nr:urease accessory protein UreE [Burkholderiales bacterium]
MKTGKDERVISASANALPLTQRIPANPSAKAAYTLALTAEERTRSRLRFETEEGATVQLGLPRGTVLRDGDLLRADEGDAVVRVRAKPEPVITARAPDALTLLRAAYHLGNRHVPVEVGKDYLRLSPDSVLADMLVQLGLTITEEVTPFQPEAGAYGGHSHQGGHAHAPFRAHP